MQRLCSPRSLTSAALLVLLSALSACEALTKNSIVVLQREPIRNEIGHQLFEDRMSVADFPAGEVSRRNALADAEGVTSVAITEHDGTLWSAWVKNGQAYVCEGACNDGGTLLRHPSGSMISGASSVALASYRGSLHIAITVPGDGLYRGTVSEDTQYAGLLYGAYDDCDGVAAFVHDGVLWLSMIRGVGEESSELRLSVFRYGPIGQEGPLVFGAERVVSQLSQIAPEMGTSIMVAPDGRMFIGFATHTAAEGEGTYDGMLVASELGDYDKWHSPWPTRHGADVRPVVIAHNNNLFLFDTWSTDNAGALSLRTRYLYFLPQGYTAPVSGTRPWDVVGNTANRGPFPFAVTTRSAATRDYSQRPARRRYSEVGTEVPFEDRLTPVTLGN